MFLENLKTALSALLENRLRSMLTLLGVVIGVFAVTATVSLGEIATAGITSQIREFGAQSLFVQRDFEAADPRRFTEDDIEALSRLPVDILRQQGVNVTAVAEDARASLRLNGTTPNAPEIDRSIELARGRYFSDVDAARGAPVVVLSSDAARELFEDEPDPVGREILIEARGNRSTYTVIGVKAPIGGALGTFANDVSGDVPLEALYRDVPGVTRGEYDFLPITIALDRDAGAIERQVRSILDRRRPPDSYQIQTVEGALSLFDTITLILQALLGGIGAISLLVGGIGILNIMLVSVTERTREIGLRKALGAAPRVILQQFLIEAIVLTVIGGTIGVALSLGVLWAIVQLVPFLDVFVINPWVVGMAFLVSVATGVVFGVWPARRAAALSPIEALRYE
ncbi:MAG: ABC transporter permease [Trueperaceae bacterium]|nr:ABC transporter permease [Trueperaceae bacterium]